METITITSVLLLSSANVEDVPVAAVRAALVAVLPTEIAIACHTSSRMVFTTSPRGYAVVASPFQSPSSFVNP